MLKKSALFAVAVCVAFAVGACGKTDPGITTAVKAKLAADTTVKAYQINVDTKNGVVTLTGSVETSAARDQAVKLARETDGVTSVVDNLTVSPAATPAEQAGEAAKQVGREVGDAAVTAAVKAKLLADTTVAGLKINVDTVNGTVTLSGNVRSAAERERAVTLAKGTEGVKDVVDKLVMQ